jgi:hypothetical protein
MRKYRDTRIVTFQQDYAPGGKVIYENGSTHAIHCETVERLQNLKVRMKVEKLDPSKIVASKIEQNRKAKAAA